jgi:adenylate cyclase class 2
MAEDNIEIEIKIKLDDTQALQKKAIELGAEKIKEGSEFDILFTNGSGEFSTGSDGGKHLRLRKSTDGNFLTCKENIKGEKTSEYLAERTEIETEVSDYENTKTILEMIGFSPINAKEKKYVKYKFQDLVLEFHTMPFLGEYLEIEGTKEQLEAVLPQLGLDLTQGIDKGYFPLFKEFVKKHNLPEDTTFTFVDEKKMGS